MSQTLSDFATPDHDRQARCGHGEVIFGQHKTPQQIACITRSLLDGGQSAVLTTRCPEGTRPLLESSFPEHELSFSELGNTALVGRPEPVCDRPIPIVTAGTSDLPVAEEAAVTCRALGHVANSIHDVGVAGVHRLFGRLDEIRQGNVIIVVAGMEGALPSVIGGLVDVPVIAVPTSVGYGASFGGIAALLGMLNSCASGVTVVNIDNGFGAALAACNINRLVEKR
jgi:NCAIR mutase (PurE)-related protein